MRNKVSENGQFIHLNFNSLIGELFECSDKDDQFGVYLAPENEITIGGFRWDTSNH